MLVAGAAPAIVHAANIMPVFVRQDSGLLVADYTALIAEMIDRDIRAQLHRAALELYRRVHTPFVAHLLEAA